MGSRIRENVTHYFECFCEVVGPQPDSSDAWIIQKYPETYHDEEVLKSVPKFAFPCEFENATVQHYSFVLTSHDSKWTFGYCRHDPKSQTAFVVLSFLPWHESFTKFLNVISELTHSAQNDELWKFLEAVYQSKVPDPGTSLTLKIHQNGQNTFTCQSPCQFQLPRIPDNRNLTEYYNAVDSNNMMIVFASMLYERRIIFMSRRLNRLSACVQSANAIIYPMHWQHIFIPVLPQQMVDYLLAPMPYLIGVSNTLLNRVRRNDLGDVVILDADNNTVETPFQDLESLPQDVVKNLRAQLRNKATLLGDGVSRAFLRALVQLIGGYRDALRFQQGHKITFSQDAFVESRPLNMQPFLRKMLELQIFQQFIEERLDMLNAGLGFSDEFEIEACSYSDKSSSRLKQQYREWLHTMRKDTSALLKSIKSRVKERGKNVGKAYKGIKSKWGGREGVPEHSSGDSPPPVTTRPRPHTTLITSAATSYRRDLGLKQRFSAASESRSQYAPLSPLSPEPGIFNLSPMNMDLMGDLQDVIFRNCSTLSESETNSSSAQSPVVDRSLKPVRSMENFPRENHSQAVAATTDMFRISPLISGTNNIQEQDTNLIRLDSLSSVDDFDPLSIKNKAVGSEKSDVNHGLGLTNPLYPYFTPQHHKAESRHCDLELLKEYGLDFKSISAQSSTACSLDYTTSNFTSLSLSPTPTTPASQLNWTKFD